MPILGDLDQATLDRLRPHWRVVDFADQAVILRKGVANEHLHFLLSGRAEVHFNLADRSEPIAITTGQMFGEISVIDEMPVTANVIATGPCRVLMVPASFFWSEIVTLPGIARSVMRRLSQMLRVNAEILLKTAQHRLEHVTLQRELQLARDIQMGMLRGPEAWFTDRGDMRLAALIEPARMVGGDFYDAFLLDQDRLVVAIGDVAGKGISAALFMVRALTLLRTPVAQWHSVARSLADANRALADGNDTAMFLTLFMAELDLRTGVLDYVNHGHTRPLLRGADGIVSFHPIEPGTVFGLLPDSVGAAGRVSLTPGASLLLYSDGVTEAEDPARHLFGADRLRRSVQQADSDDPAVLVGAVANAVAGHAGAAERSDDMTLLALTWLGKDGTGNPATTS